MIRRILVVAAVLVTACASDDSPRSSRPNILLVSLDTLRADHLSTYGYERLTSPFLSELASQGVKFERAFVNTLATTVSHTTMLSSLYQETHRVAYHLVGARAAEQVPPNAIPTAAVMVQQVLQEAGYTTLAVTDGGLIDGSFGFDRGFDVFDARGGGVVSGTHKMLELIAKRPARASEPIFAFYHTYEIHSPYRSPAGYDTLFGRTESRFEPTSANLVALASQPSPRLAPNDLEAVVAAYDAGIRFTDDVLREFVAELESRGFFQDGLLVVTADHGEAFGEHGTFLHGGQLYEELLRIPLVIRGMGVPRGRVVEEPVSLVDVAPTILAWAGVAAPPRMEGRDLFAAPPERPGEEAAVFAQVRKTIYAVRTRDWKLIQKRSPPRTELYHLAEDPAERENLVDVHPAKAYALGQRLEAWQRERRPIEQAGAAPIELGEAERRQLQELGYLPERTELPEDGAVDVP